MLSHGILTQAQYPVITEGGIPAGVPLTNLINYMDAANYAGSGDWLDESGNSTDFTPYGVSHVSTGRGWFNFPGTSGNRFEQASGNTYMQGTQARTMFFWVRNNFFESCFCSLGDLTAGTKFTFRRDSSTPNLRFEIEGDAELSSYSVTATGTDWEFIGLTFSGTTIAGGTFFQANYTLGDTALNSDTAGPGNTVNTGATNWVLGINNWNGSSGNKEMAGDMAIAGFYDRALSYSEMQAIYDATKVLI